MGRWVGVIVTVVVLLVSTCIAVVAALVPLLLMVLVVRRLSRLQFVVMNPAPAAPRHMKRTTCRSCGGAKLVPPRTAYLYCDYCGCLTDWDFKLACATPTARPGPVYENLLRQRQPAIDAAKASADRNAYRAIQNELFDAHMRACPQSYSVRLGDPSYRAALLSATAEHHTRAAFDADCARQYDAMNAAVRGLVWVGFGQVESTSFWRLFEAFRAHNAAFVALGSDLAYPDEPTPSLQAAISASAFAQGWLSYLPKDEQEKLIQTLGLQGEYAPIRDVVAENRRCGACNATLRVVDGARVVVCEQCGHKVDATHPEVTCSGCGTAFSVPYGKAVFSCPSCDADLRA